jgi:transcriptional regulator with XRE-family HTH domain
MWNKADFGRAVVFIGAHAGMDQKRLAQALGVEPKAVTNWKKGTSSPQPSTMRQLPVVLRCTMAEIEEVAEVFRQWRLKRGVENLAAEDLGEAAPARYGGTNPETERKIGHAMVEIYRLLTSGQ